MAILTSKPIIHKLSGEESKILDSEFGSYSDDFDLNFTETDSNGFSSVNTDADMQHDGKSTAMSFMDTRMVPFTVTTDVNTATQVMMLLEMIRYCMENSKEVLDTTTGEAKEYSINLKIRNRGKSSFIVSVGDESMPPIPVTKDDFLIGN